MGPSREAQYNTHSNNPQNQDQGAGKKAACTSVLDDYMRRLKGFCTEDYTINAIVRNTELMNKIKRNDR